MTVGSLASSHWKKARKLTLLLFGNGFNSSKCSKTMAKMAVARIKLLRNKRQVVVKQMRRDIAMLLESGQDATARIRVEHVIREQNILTANEFIELFCELIVARLPIIAKRKECPLDLKEGISSLIFSAPRCSDIPELTTIRDIFEKKYGKDFVSAATDLRPDCGVNRMLIDKLSVRTPSGEVKLKVLKEIAKEYLVEWDTKESEAELLKPPEELIEGPQTFVSASSLPIKPMPKQSVERNNPSTRYSDHSERSSTMNFQDTASAAKAAAESAKQAIAAAGAAAYLANRDTYNVTANSMNTSSFSNDFNTVSGNTAPSMPNRSQINPMKQSYRRHSYNVPSAHSDFNSDESDYDEEIEVEDPKGRVKVQPNNHAADVEDGKTCRRHSYNAPPANSDIKFDESDGEEEEPEIEERTSGFNQPPNRPAPNLPSARGTTQNMGHQVHPKLPDYDEVAARFEALKLRKS
ncbi:hypothetical protein LguiB_032961 [Lonicera macranthoides]